MPRDGNCLFSAVCQQLPRIGHLETTARELRSLVAEYMKTNPARGDMHYRDFVAKPAQQGAIQDVMNVDTEIQSDLDAHSDDPECRWRSYLRRLKAGAWGENLTVQGLCEMLDCNLNIISTQLPDEEATEITPSYGRAAATLYLGLITQYHYTALERDQQNVVPDSNHGSDEDNEPHGEVEQNKLWGIHYDSCLQPENLESEHNTFSLAPGEGGKPIHMLDDKHFEEMAYPTQYPTGNSGITSSRPVKLTS